MSADRTIASDRSDLTVAIPSDDARVTVGVRPSRFMTRTSIESRNRVAYLVPIVLAKRREAPVG
jgi:hypothetical protein